MTEPLYDRGLAIAATLTDAGLAATIDPRAATPPCVLVTPPNGDDQVMCGVNAEWSLMVLVPGTGNAEAFLALDRMRAAVMALFDGVRFTFESYAISADAPPVPAYRIRFTEGV